MAVRPAAHPTVAEHELAAIFGDAGGSSDLPSRARASRRRFVRSHTGVAFWSERATGQVLTAHQAYETFGWTVLSQLIDKPAVPIVKRGAEAAPAVAAGREQVGASVHQLALRAGVSEADVEAVEAGRRRMPMRVLSRIAQALALSPTGIGVGADGGGDPALGVRFRRLRTDLPDFTTTVALGLMEAAWVIAEQGRLETWLDPSRDGLASRFGFRQEPLGAMVYPPVHRRAMELAARTRQLLDIPHDAPIIDFMPMIERDLGIPLVQVELPPNFLGATIENGATRGIAVNVGGINASVWTRRMTVAHELCHYLWDPSEQLDRLRVDDAEAIEGDARAQTDPVEMRANAFAAEFLAPQAVVVRLHDADGGGPAVVSDLMERFGISFTALKWQLHNGSNGRIDQATLRSKQGTTPSHAWLADVGRRTDYFPLPETPPVRRGRFVDLCLYALDANLVTAETVADYLGVDLDTLTARLDEVRDLVADASTQAPASAF